MKIYKLLLISSVIAIVGAMLLASSVTKREQERKEIATAPYISDTIESNSSEWARYYPRQYSSWKQTKHSKGIVDMLAMKPQLPILWAGYGFAKDYNAPRGHYYAVQDNINTLRTGAPEDEKTGPMPTACWTCKSPDVPRLIDEEGENEYFTGKWAKYGDEVSNSIGCADCHSSQDGQLEINRPYLDRGLESAGLPTFAESTHQVKRSLVCAQCHSEYYFKPTEWTNDEGETQTAKVVTFPWSEGLTAEKMEKYYNDRNFKDWTHKISRTPMLKAQHPGYEIFQTGIHGQKGVSCADCHMPYTQEGSVKFSDHNVGSPLDSMDRSCMQCHRESEEKLRGIVAQKFGRKEFLMEIAMDNLAKAHLEAGKAWEVGATEAEMKPILGDIRSAQWKWDYSIASHGSFFHAPEETLRLLASANETAQQARLKLVRVLAAHGAIDFSAPDFSTKEQAQELAGVPLEQLVEAKLKFKATLEKEWIKQATEAGHLDEEVRKDVDLSSSYFSK